MKLLPLPPETAVSHKTHTRLLFMKYLRNMYPKRALVLIISTLLIPLAAFSQSIYREQFRGPYILLYKLNQEQAAFIAKHPNLIDTAILYTRLVGKVHADSVIPLHRKPI